MLKAPKRNFKIRPIDFPFLSCRIKTITENIPLRHQKHNRRDMRRNEKNFSIPYSVLILHNVMSDWTSADIETAEQAVTRMKYGLTSLGMEATSIPVQRDIEGALRGFDSRECIVFNWCEGLDGAPNAYDAIPPVLERLGFMYTGSDAWCLHITEDKVTTKEILRRHRIPTPKSAVYSRPARNGLSAPAVTGRYACGMRTRCRAWRF